MSQYRGFGGDDLPDPQMVFDHLKRNLKYILLGIVVIIMGILASGSFFTVDPEEQALVLRFGTPLDQAYGPGLHFKIPLIDQVYIVPVERQHRIEIGFRSDPGEQTTVREEGFKRESLMLTGDLSLAHVRWSVLYKINNLRAYLFNVKDQEGNVRDVAMGAMRAVVGDYSLDEMLTGKYELIAAEAAAHTQLALDAVESGIRITEVAIQSTEVPDEAKKAFHELNKSVSQVKQRIRAAHASQKSIRGEAEEKRQTAIGKAEGEYAQTVQNAQGEATAFMTQLAEYRRAPEITRQWMYMDAMNEMLGKTGNKIILDKDASDIVKLLPLEDLGGSGTIQRAIPAILPTARPVPEPAESTPRVRAGGAR
ncbi:MAG: membrane protease subunit HflK [Myxococcota bacterium]